MSPQTTGPVADGRPLLAFRGTCARRARRAQSARRAAADERGMTIVLVLVVLLVGMAAAAASLAAALSSGYDAYHGARLARAQQAADAGVQAQLYTASEEDLGSSTYNLNGGPLGLADLLDCTVPQLNASLQITGVANVTANAAGVCPRAIGPGGQPTALSQPVGDHAFYQSELITGQTNFLSGTPIGSQNGSAMIELHPVIVSIGRETSTTGANAAPVYSREEAILAPIAPLQAIEGEGSVKIGGLSLLGIPIATVLNGDVLSRGSLQTPAVLAGLNLSNGLIATLAYAGSYSGGLSVANLQQVPGSQIIRRPPVSVSPSKPDCSPASDCGALGGAYNAADDSFSLSTGTVTFAPGDYVFCSFYAAPGTTVDVAPTASAPVRIFIDNPNSARCAADRASADPNLGDFNDPAGFANGLLGADGVVGASGLQVYVAGDGSYDDNTSVQIGPAGTSGLLSLSAAIYGAIVYAPTSAVTVNVPAACVLGICTGGVLEGAVVGNDTTVNALVITQDLDIGNFPLYAGVNAFRVVQYVRCDDSVTSLTGNPSTDERGC